VKQLINVRETPVIKRF